MINPTELAKQLLAKTKDMTKSEQFSQALTFLWRTRYGWGKENGLKRKVFMKKLLVIGLLLAVFASCSLVESNPFIGTWYADMGPLDPDPGDYCTITFYSDNTVVEINQIYSVPNRLSGIYDYTDTVLDLNYKGYLTIGVNYVIYNDVMVWEDFLYFYR